LARKNNNGIFASLFIDMLHRLSEMKSGASGVIERFDENEAQVKLMEMGCIPGEKVSVEAIAPMGDPIAIQVSGYCLSIRKNEAKHIWVEIA
jgi:ferrous iron transport protein A